MRSLSNNRLLKVPFLAVWAVVLSGILSSAAGGQVVRPSPVPSYTIYIDPLGGNDADALVEQALLNNAELTAMRKEAEAGVALISQAKLRPNPTLDITGTRQINGTDYSRMIQAAIPLELGGRRAARTLVAESELEIRKQAVAERERQLASDVRSKFGESLAAIHKLKFIEEILAVATENYLLVSARVDDGRRPPLEKNQEIVELNRIRAMREIAEGAVELRLLELRNLVGTVPEQGLRLKGNLETFLDSIPPQADAQDRALFARPDLAGAKAIEQLAYARIEQAKSEGRVDADVMAGYQTMKSGFPLLGTQQSTGELLPIDGKFHFFTFGVKLALPVRNRNQGAIAASKLELEAARNRREFGELTIKREVASAYVRYFRAMRAKEIFRVGVREQAAGNLSVVRQTYDLGSKTLLDYIAEQRRYIEIEIGYIDSELEAFLARVEILRSVNARELIKK